MAHATNREPNITPFVLRTEELNEELFDGQDLSRHLFIQEEELHYNVTAGIVLSDHSLVLQSITRESAGRYTCMAVNVEGRAGSNVVDLEVMFAPICKHVLYSAGWRYQNATPPPLNVPEEVHGALKHETISFVCEVEASPTSVTFYWTFNSSGGDLSDIPSPKYTNEGTSSRLNYTPSSDMDYGTLGCWASNIVGPSKQPCLYQVIAAGRPYPLQNCTAYNQTGSLIRISCVEGYDGGLPQKFVAIVDKQRLESENPYWELELHKPTTVALYAVNMKGSSDPVIMEGEALKGVAKFTGESAASSVDMSPILIGLGGTATGLGLIVTGVLMALWRKHAATPAKLKRPPQQPSIATFAGKAEEEDGNPDLIPTRAMSNHSTANISSPVLNRQRWLTILSRKLLARNACTLHRPVTSLDSIELESMAEPLDVPTIDNVAKYPYRTSSFRSVVNSCCTKVLTTRMARTFYSLQRPHRYSETMIRSTVIQESCI
ncbi:Nephrin [Habropoda laboriosa]|uniref:Nephrin n=1 Tax=Habropoda laboriosa TaxID=597456 RepID=A0A0L7QXI6_9HYME|nr:Nephrin [Habropoda laboriosa]